MLSPPVTGEQQTVWPDASTDFDEPPADFPLRRAVSEGNLAEGAQVATKPSRSRKLRGSQTSLGSASGGGGRSSSQSRRHRRHHNHHHHHYQQQDYHTPHHQHHVYSSAPVSPLGSRPTSPVTQMQPIRPPRTSAEVLHDAQRAMIMGEEIKAAEAARQDPAQSVLLSCKRLGEPPYAAFFPAAARFAPMPLPPELLAPGAGHTPSSIHGELMLRLATNVRTGGVKSGVVLCGDDGHCAISHSAPLSELSGASVAGLRQCEANSRPMLVQLDFSNPRLTHGFRCGPSSLVLSLSQQPERAELEVHAKKEAERNAVSVAWPARAAVGDAELMAVMRTLVVPMGMAFSPDIVFVYIRFSRSVSPAAYARMVRSLMILAHGRLLLLLPVLRDDPHAHMCAMACMASLQGDPLPPLPQPELCCDLGTMALLEKIVGPLTPAWPCLSSTLSFRLLSEKQFYNVHSDDTVTATVALASLSMSSVREEEEDAMMDGNRKRALSESVTGAAAALLKVVRNSSTSSPVE